MFAANEQEKQIIVCHHVSLTDSFLSDGICLPDNYLPPLTDRSNVMGPLHEEHTGGSRSHPNRDEGTMMTATPSSSIMSHAGVQCPSRRSRIRCWRTLFAVAVCSISMTPSAGFTPSSLSTHAHPPLQKQQRTTTSPTRPSPSSAAPSSSSALPMVWWFGGSEAQEMEDGDSCELVAVRIDRTSANSRRIGGEIIVDRPLDDVWAILTDYDNLSIHVPNLVESRRVSGGVLGSGEPGDGSYRCRLFQKGSQKIVGFQFAASVTMDMTESIVPTSEGMPQQRGINFKCVDSQFFSVFDGDWTAIESPMPDPITGEKTTTIKYVVDVRPKGPVPVAALEWRIREDVPTNLRAVKKAAVEVGREGVIAMQQRLNGSAVSRALVKDTVRSSVGQDELRNGSIGRPLRRSAREAAASAVRRTAQKAVGKANEAVSVAANAVKSRKRQFAPVRVDWYEDETMATYLDDIERP